MKWGGRTRRQSAAAAELQGNNKFQGHAKDLQASGFWKQNLFGMRRIGTKNCFVKEYFVKQWCSQWQYWSSKKKDPLLNFKKSSIWFFHFVFEHNHPSKSLHGITASQNIPSHVSFFVPILPIPSRFCSRTQMPVNLLHFLWIYCCLATAAAALCLLVLLPTSFAQGHCAGLLGQGPGWALTFVPQGGVCFYTILK